MNNTKSYFNKEAADFDHSYKDGSQITDIIRKLTYRWNEPLIKKRLEALVNLAGDCKGKRVLEVGVGAGQYAIELAKTGPDEIVGIDYSEGMLSFARKNIEKFQMQNRISLVNTDFLKLGEKFQNSFDICFACGVLDYVCEKDQQEFLKKMTGCTKLKGYVIVSFPKRGVLHAYIRSVWLGYWKKVPVFFYSSKDIEKLTRGAGLVFVDKKDCGALVVNKYQKES